MQAAPVTRERSSETTQLSEALNCAKRGWLVFPLHGITASGQCTCFESDCGNAGKHPRTAHGFKDATNDEAQIRQWWTQWLDANLGIRTGAGSGLVVLDIDPRHGGDETLHDLERDHGALPDTVCVLTGGGGSHFYFRYPGGYVRSRSSIAPGIDVKADGGYVVGASSRHVSGKDYCWEIGYEPDDLPLARVPEWLLTLISGPVGAQSRAAQTSPSRFDRKVALEGLEKGQRDDQLFRLACSLRAENVPQEEAERTVIEAAAKCDPPLLEAWARDKVANVYKRYPAGTSYPKLSKNFKQNQLIKRKLLLKELTYDTVNTMTKGCVDRYGDSMLTREPDKQRTREPEHQRIREPEDQRTREPDNQEYQENQDIHGYGDAPPPPLQPVAVAVEAASKAALEFGADRGLRRREVIFRLARRLWTVLQNQTVDSLSLRPALDLFLDLIAEHRQDSRECNRDDAWVEFLYAWDKVRVPEGEGLLEVAAGQAKVEPIVPADDLGPDFQTLASVAYHLQRLKGDEPIFLPVRTVGGLLGKTAEHASRLVHLLVRQELIEPVDFDYSYVDRKAKTYRFLLDSGRYTIARSTVEPEPSEGLFEFECNGKAAA